MVFYYMWFQDFQSEIFISDSNGLLFYLAGNSRYILNQ